MITVMTVVGARPQFVKAAALSRLIRERSGIREVLVHTGQHYDEAMSAVFFAELGLPAPAHALMIGSAGHGAQTGRMMEALEPLIEQHQPDCVLVYGDTNSTLAGALAAAKLHVPVAHVEAGLRSHNRRMPEEINRVMVDHLAELLFAPTDAARENLANEGIREGVAVVGDVMVDVCRHFQATVDLERPLSSMGLKPGSYALATIHRAENTDDARRLGAIMLALIALAAEMPVVVPLHPRTRKTLARLGWLGRLESRLRLIEPLGYQAMAGLERHARLIVADSGGVQKEAFFYGVPCVVPRDETEWQELVPPGWVRLAPPGKRGAVYQAVVEALARPPRVIPNPYGDGASAARILAALESRFGRA